MHTSPSPLGRTHREMFVAHSVRYLFRTTYERSDEMTLGALVTYLNAAMPMDKHEDFDTPEVASAARSLHDRGLVVLEGELIRPVKV